MAQASLIPYVCACDVSHGRLFWCTGQMEQWRLQTHPLLSWAHSQLRSAKA